jgi:hypothetical protein
MWLADETKLGPGVVSFDPSLYLKTYFTADRHEDDEPEEERSGLTWTLVRQRGVTIDILVYV